MGYIGNTPSRIQAAFQGVESKSYNGDGSTETFSLDRAVANTYDIEVMVNNVQQSPYDGSYSVSGTDLVFSEAPSTGTNNIYVTYRDTPQPSIAPTDGSVTTAKLADGAVTAAKLADGAAVPDQTGHAGQFLTTDGTNADWANASSAEVYGFSTNSNGELVITTTNQGADNISAAEYDSFSDVVFAASGFSWSVDSSGNLIATV